MMFIALQQLQIEAGLSTLLLKDPTPELNYITQCWLSSLRDFLRGHQMHIKLHENWNVSLAREGNRFIMDILRCSGNFSNDD